MKPVVSTGASRRSALALGSAAAAGMALSALGMLSGCASRPLKPDAMAAGIVWQIDNETLAMKGNWDKIGVRTLLVQWTAVDDVGFVSGSPWPQARRLPDWDAIARQPWARDVILGLAGRSGENAARADFPNLVEISERLAKLPTPLNVVGWYFPVEIDSSWQNARELGPLLARLPRPLWLSLYDRVNVGPETLVQWLQSWLPADVGIFFQDGVGVDARTAAVARRHADVLIRSLGKNRVRMIAEAFRPKSGGGFRPATAAELREQLQAYQGLSVYLFDGPHYLSEALVNELTLDL